MLPPLAVPHSATIAPFLFRLEKNQKPSEQCTYYYKADVAKRLNDWCGAGGKETDDYVKRQYYYLLKVKEMIQTMLGLGMALDQIAQIADMSAEEVEQMIEV